jgi:hypothetical protein
MDSYSKKILLAYTYTDEPGIRDEISGGDTNMSNSKYDHDSFLKHCTSAILDHINSNSGIDVLTYGGLSDDDSEADDEIETSEPTSESKQDEQAIIAVDNPELEVSEENNEKISDEDTNEQIKEAEEQIEQIEDVISKLEEQIDSLTDNVDTMDILTDEKNTPMDDTSKDTKLDQIDIDNLNIFNFMKRNKSN